MKNLFITFLVVLIVGITTNDTHSSHYWAKTYGGIGNDYASSIQETSDGGYIVAGYTNSFGAGGLDFWILKLDGSGNICWQKTYGRNEWDSAFAIQQTTDGGYIVAGRIGYPPPPEEISVSGAKTTSSCSGIWILKLDSNGEISWQYCYGMSQVDKPTSIRQTTDGGYIVIGNTHSSFPADIWVLKLNGNGEIAWQKTYGGSGFDYAYSIQQTTNGGYIIAGSTESFGSVWDEFWVLRLESDGNISWQKTYRVSDLVLNSSILQTADGGYILAGDAGDPVFRFGIHVLKLDGNGTIIWQKFYEEFDCDDLDYFSSIQQTSDGGYIIAGEVEYNAGYPDFDYDCWLLKLDNNGDVIWRKVYKASNSITSLQQTTDGGYIVTAHAGFLIMKLDSNGEIPFCDIVVTRNVKVSETFISDVDTNIVGQSTSATITDTNVSPQESSAEITTICGGDYCSIEQIYGEHSEEVEILRYFRDNILSKTPEGQEIIRLYYEWSPMIVKAMEENEEFKEAIKEMIDGILLLIRREVQ